MDASIPYEFRQLQLLVRQFIDAEIRPLEKAMVEEWGGAFPTIEWQRLVEKSKRLGLFQAFVPREWGGGGVRSYLAYILVYEEIGKFSMTVRHLFDAGYEYGSAEATREQIEGYYLPVWRGEKRVAYGITEPDAGSDNLRMSTRAIRRDGDWVLNGSKCFTSNADCADFLVVLAKTDLERRRISCFLVDRQTPGVRVGRQQKGMGVIHETYDVHLDDVVIPARNLVGEEGRGMRVGFDFANLYRLRTGSLGIGAAGYAIDEMKSYARQRVTFGEPLANRQAIQAMIVDSWIEMEGARWLNYYCCAQADQGTAVQELTALSAAAKIQGSELGCRVLDRAIQVHGGAGYCADLPLERMYREMRAARIYEGATETLKHLVIARSLLGNQ